MTVFSSVWVASHNLQSTQRYAPSNQKHTSMNSMPLTSQYTQSQHLVGTRRSLKNSGSHIDASHSRQPLVKGERLVRYEVNAVMLRGGQGIDSYGSLLWSQCVGDKLAKNMSLDMVMHRRQGRQRRQRTAEVQEMTSSQASARRIVPPKGVLLPALCHASATLEGP